MDSSQVSKNARYRDRHNVKSIIVALIGSKPEEAEIINKWYALKGSKKSHFLRAMRAYFAQMD